MTAIRTTCPRCGRRLRWKADGIFRWKVCTKACGWTVFSHGEDERDKREEA